MGLFAGRYLTASAWPRRTALVAVAALAALSYTWAANQDLLEYYYASAVRSMAGSWHDFIFGAFDPAGTITLDKLPGAFWLQALSVRAFGLHPWAIFLPQAVEGVVTVLVLYRAVSRLAGPAAGLVAALVLAVSPAVVALDRGNISDSLMIMLLVLAADAVSAAIVSGGAWWRLVVAGVCVGLAFQAKMIQAWMVLPALGLAYLISGPGTTWRRVAQLAAGGVVVALVSLSWMTAVSLVPAASLPYVDGSHDDSVYTQVFVYNGFGRFSDQTPLQLRAGALRPGYTLPVPAPSPGRLLRGSLGRDTGWLIPAAAVAGLWGLVSRRRQPRDDPLRACIIVWGGWLVTLFAVFSAITTLNFYYTAALSPAVAAVIGAGLAAAWSPDRAQAEAAEHPGLAEDSEPAGRPRLAWRLGLAVVVAGTAAYTAWLIPPSGAPGWLIPAVAAIAAAAVGVIGWSVAKRGNGPLTAALATSLAAVVLTPAVACVIMTARHQSAFDTPFEAPAVARALAAAALLPGQSGPVIARFQETQDGAPYLMAAQTASVPSLVIYFSGQEALPIGGFDGTTPSPTLSQLQADIGQGRFHLVWVASVTDPRMRWIAAHCARLSARYYDCAPGQTG